MAIDLNSRFSDGDVAALLASVHDDRIWRLEVSRQGIASLRDVTNSPPPAGTTLHCYFEAWLEGNGYVGQEAAKDQKWIGRVADALRRNWPNLERDQFIDDF